MNVYVPPLPKIFSANGISPKNWSTIFTAYTMTTIPPGINNHAIITFEKKSEKEQNSAIVGTPFFLSNFTGKNPAPTLEKY